MTTHTLAIHRAQQFSICPALRDCLAAVALRTFTGSATAEPTAKFPKIENCRPKPIARGGVQMMTEVKYLLSRHARVPSPNPPLFGGGVPAQRVAGKQRAGYDGEYQASRLTMGNGFWPSW